MVDYPERRLIDPNFKNIPRFYGDRYDSPLDFLDFQISVYVFLNNYSGSCCNFVNAVLDKIEYPAISYVRLSSDSIREIFRDLRKIYGEIFGPKDYIDLIDQSYPRVDENLHDFLLRLQELVWHSEHYMEQSRYTPSVFEKCCVGKLRSILPKNHASYHKTPWIQTFREAYSQIFDTSDEIKENEKPFSTPISNEDIAINIFRTINRMTKSDQLNAISPPVKTSINCEADLEVLNDIGTLFKSYKNSSIQTNPAKISFLPPQIFESQQEEIRQTYHAISSVEPCSKSVVLQQSVIYFKDQLKIREIKAEEPAIAVTGGDVFAYPMCDRHDDQCQEKLHKENLPKSLITNSSSEFSKLPGRTIFQDFDPSCKISWYHISLIKELMIHSKIKFLDYQPIFDAWHSKANQLKPKINYYEYGESIIEFRNMKFISSFKISWHHRVLNKILLKYPSNQIFSHMLPTEHDDQKKKNPLNCKKHFIESKPNIQLNRDMRWKTTFKSQDVIKIMIELLIPFTIPKKRIFDPCPIRLLLHEIPERNGITMKWLEIKIAGILFFIIIIRIHLSVESVKYENFRHGKLKKSEVSIEILNETCSLIDEIPFHPYLIRKFRVLQTEFHPHQKIF